MKRREFLHSSALAGAGITAPSVAASVPQPGTPPAGQREYWVSVARRLADPVLSNLAAGTLKASMPVEEIAGAGRASVTHLEAFGRLLAGLAPWLELAEDGSEEGRLRARYADGELEVDELP